MSEETTTQKGRFTFAWTRLHNVPNSSPAILLDGEVFLRLDPAWPQFAPKGREGRDVTLDEIQTAQRAGIEARARAVVALLNEAMSDEETP